MILHDVLHCTDNKLKQEILPPKNPTHEEDSFLSTQQAAATEVFKAVTHLMRCLKSENKNISPFISIGR